MAWRRSSPNRSLRTDGVLDKSTRSVSFQDDSSSESSSIQVITSGRRRSSLISRATRRKSQTREFSFRSQSSLLSREGSDDMLASTRTPEETTTAATTTSSTSTTKHPTKEVVPFWTCRLFLWAYVFVLVACVFRQTWALHAIPCMVFWELLKIPRKWARHYAHDAQFLKVCDAVEHARQYAQTEMTKTVTGGNGRRRQEAIALVKNYIVGTMVQQRMHKCDEIMCMEERRQSMRQARRHSRRGV